MTAEPAIQLSGAMNLILHRIAMPGAARIADTRLLNRGFEIAETPQTRKKA
jgi:hypothetical protein